MNQLYVLFNPLSGDRNGKEDAKKLSANAENARLIDVRKISSYETFVGDLDESDRIILCGGDGTVNHFANNIASLKVPCPVFYYAVGSGNDFAHDLGHDRADEPNFEINQYLVNLPQVQVGDVRRVFVNGIGYGIDGYCCEVGDEEREKNIRENKFKKINYTTIAIKGLLFHFKPKNAVVTVDGEEHRFTKVWLAPTMNGRFFGGGMMPTPAQDRLNEERTVSLMVFHGASALRTLMIFPSLFKGEHIKHEKFVKIFTGKEISVSYDRPCALQIDGETYKNVSSYTVKASV